MTEDTNGRTLTATFKFSSAIFAVTCNGLFACFSSNRDVSCQKSDKYKQCFKSAVRIRLQLFAKVNKIQPIFEMFTKSGQRFDSFLACVIVVWLSER